MGFSSQKRSRPSIASCSPEKREGLDRTEKGGSLGKKTYQNAAERNVNATASYERKRRVPEEETRGRERPCLLQKTYCVKTGRGEKGQTACRPDGKKKDRVHGTRSTEILEKVLVPQDNCIVQGNDAASGVRAGGENMPRLRAKKRLDYHLGGGCPQAPEYGESRGEGVDLAVGEKQSSLPREGGSEEID